jgi:hypothetical protein
MLRGCWRENPNYWRAITRLNAVGQVAHQHRRVPHSRLNQRHLAEPDYDPRRRACLAFACWVVRFLLCDDLGVISALMAAIRALNEPLLTALTMNRDDALLWISLFSFVVLCGLVLWALLRL